MPKRVLITGTSTGFGFRSNVIPGSAEATINCLPIPGKDIREFISELRRVMDDPESMYRSHRAVRRAATRC